MKKSILFAIASLISGTEGRYEPKGPKTGTFCIKHMITDMYVKAVQEDGKNVLKLAHQADSKAKEDRWVFIADIHAADLQGVIETTDGRRLRVTPDPENETRSHLSWY